MYKYQWFRAHQKKTLLYVPFLSPCCWSFDVQKYSEDPRISWTKSFENSKKCFSRGWAFPYRWHPLRCTESTEKAFMWERILGWCEIRPPLEHFIRKDYLWWIAIPGRRSRSCDFKKRWSKNSRRTNNFSAESKRGNPRKVNRRGLRRLPLYKLTCGTYAPKMFIRSEFWAPQRSGLSAAISYRYIRTPKTIFLRSRMLPSNSQNGIRQSSFKCRFSMLPQ